MISCALISTNIMINYKLIEYTLLHIKIAYEKNIKANGNSGG